MQLPVLAVFILGVAWCTWRRAMRGGRRRDMVVVRPDGEEQAWRRAFAAKPD